MTKTNKFAQALKAQDASESVSVTENGALGFARTGSRLVDFFFKVGSMRNMSPDEIKTHFAEAYAEDSKRALELLFFVRDCRGGMGEKNVFNVCYDWLVQNYPADAVKLLKLIPEYGSWKTFVALTDSFRKDADVEKQANYIVKDKWLEDISNWGEVGHVSLLGKWMPSENASSGNTKRLATYWRNVLGLDSRTYRKALSKFRQTIKVVERDMTSGNWNEIDYNTVPARAGMLYKNAFLKHDEERRRAWLAALKKPEENPGVKINTTGLTIPDLVSKYITISGWGTVSVPNEDDPTIEAAWSDLVAKGMMPEDAISMIPVMDGSGSMYSCSVGNGKTRPIEVSLGLGLYLANINTPAWRGMCIEFGSHPCFFQVPVGASLREQLKIAIQHNDCGSTDIQAVFNLILKTANKNGFSQKDIPQIVTFSDMEFNQAYAPSYSRLRNNSYRLFDSEVIDDCQNRLFQIISKTYAAAGYDLPKMVFWNICSRSGTIPVTENKMGVALLSGFSQSIMDMLLSGKLDPLSILLEKLDAPRYDLVRKALA